MRSLAVSLCALALSVAAGAAAEAPATPAAIDDLVYARSFTLATGYSHDWRKERPFVTSGTLVVLQVKPELVAPRQTAEPVLYAGDQTAQRLNGGGESGHVIAIIPGSVDLTQAAIWFGRPELPERIDSDRIAAERALAEAANIQPFSAEKVQAAVGKGGPPLESVDLLSMLRDHVAELLLQYSPQEKELADTWRLPAAR